MPVGVPADGRLVEARDLFVNYFGFRPPPSEYFWILAIMVVAYLGIAEAAKRLLYAHTATLIQA